MAGHGGARNRSGPAPDPDSARSEARGYSLEFLPPTGFDGPIPEFPLPDPSPRESVLWDQAWRTPQACAWSLPAEQWRIPTVALWVRLTAKCESPSVPASYFAQLLRLADRIGMSTAGLREMGWRIANVTKTADVPTASEEPADEVHERRERRLRGTA